MVILIDEKEIRTGYQKFKDDKSAKERQTIADKHNLTQESLKDFIDEIMNRMIFDGEKLTDLLAPLELGWKDRSVKEKALMEDLTPLLNKRVQGSTIAGLNVYE